MKYLKIDVMNKDKSQMILIRISKAFKQQQQRYLKRMKSNAVSDHYMR
jgi:hypothetical protein